jgi:hypothetical protein
VRIKLGFKVWSTLSAMLLSLVVISGCNEEAATPSSSPAPTPAPVAKAGVEPKKPDMPPPPTPPKTDTKAPEKK